MAKPHRTHKKANHGKRPANARARRAKRRKVRRAMSSAVRCQHRAPCRPSARRFDSWPREDSSSICRRSISTVRLRRWTRFAASIRSASRWSSSRRSSMSIEQDYACVGYKDITDHEFWVRGHMPGLPLMPGVVMLESIAQLCSFVTQRYDLLGLRDGRLRRPGRRAVSRSRAAGRPADRDVQARKGPPRANDHLQVSGRRQRPHRRRRNAQRHSDSGRGPAEAASRDSGHKLSWAAAPSQDRSAARPVAALSLKRPNCRRSSIQSLSSSSDAAAGSRSRQRQGVVLAAARGQPEHNFLGIEIARKYARYAAARLAQATS